MIDYLSVVDDALLVHAHQLLAYGPHYCAGCQIDVLTNPDAVVRLWAVHYDMAGLLVRLTFACACNCGDTGLRLELHV